MKRRLELLSRVMVAIGVVSASISFAVPAWSAGGPTITWNGVLATSPVGVDGTVAVSATVQGSGPLDVVTSVTVDLLPVEGSQVLATLCTTNAPVKKVTVSLQWNTTRGVAESVPGCQGNVNGSGFSANGRYRLRITAAQGVFDSGQSVRVVDVSNVPGAPIEVTSEFDPDAQAFTVDWAPNAEPDVSGYLVQRCRVVGDASCGDASWTDSTQVGGSVSIASVPVEDAGTYRFRVAATRPAADGSVLRSSWSSASAPVTLQGKTEDPGGDSGDPGGDGGGDPDQGSPDGGDGGGSDPDSGGGRTPSDPGGGLTVAPGSASGNGGSSGSRGSEGASRTTVSTAEGGRSLPPRLVKRSDGSDGTYEEALPYGSSPVGDEVAGPLGLLSAEHGPALATVPLAAGLLALVFGLQMRYLSRRAEALALPDGGDAGGEPGTAGRRAAWLEPSDEGGFVANWRRWLRPDDT